MFRLAPLLIASVLLVSAASGVTIERLRVEDRDQPLGIYDPAPRLSWQLHSDQRAQRQSAYQIIVASSRELLAKNTGDLWDTGKVASSETFGIAYGGPPLRADARYFWRVRVWDGDNHESAWSESSWWQMGLLAPTDWKSKWIGANAETNSPLLRKDFALLRTIAHATAYVYASGWYRLLLNGTELTERVLAPVNSNYPKGLFYDSYDVTALLTTGANAVGLWLGYGYNQSYSKYGYRWNGPPAALFQLEIVFTDGSTQTLASDGTWKWTASPIVENDIYHGETYDARREIPDWSRANFDASAWTAVALRAAPDGPLKSCPFPGLSVVADLHPVKLTEPKPGVFIFDFGQNIAGWVRLKTNGPGGTKIVLRHAEELHDDGTLDTKTNRAARATDTYTLGGHGNETYEPRFTYHGFRYVEVTGVPGAPTLDSLTGRAVRAAVEEAGSFRCSAELINRIHDNFTWTIANNLVGIPTDTATRDERTPCQMDSLAVEEAAMCNFNLGPYYTKWLNDIAGDGGNLPNWTGDQVVLPFLLYQNYGDRRILEKHFVNMQQVVDKFASTAVESKYWSGGFGDWAAPNPDDSYEGSFSEGELVARAFFIRCARIVSDTAQILGDRTKVDHYAALANRLCEEFEKRFFNPKTSTYSSGRQVTSILPLAFDLVPAEKRPAVIAMLRQRIEGTDGGHLDTGIFGTRYLFDVLIGHGLADLALAVLTRPGYPGFADQIAHGATTTWEQWSYGGSMQTHDHAMFSGPDATFFSRLAGIQPGTPGFREIVIRPTFPTALSFVECSRQTSVGKISSHWRRTKGHLVLNVSIPVNTTARVYLPAKTEKLISELGRPVQNAPGVSAVGSEAQSVVVMVGSGDYEFSAPLTSTAVGR